MAIGYSDFAVPHPEPTVHQLNLTERNPELTLYQRILASDPGERPNTDLNTPEKWNWLIKTVSSAICLTMASGDRSRSAGCRDAFELRGGHMFLSLLS